MESGIRNRECRMVQDLFPAAKQDLLTMASKHLLALTEAIRERPVLILIGSNALTAFGALYLHTGSLDGIKKLILSKLFRAVLGSLRVVAGGVVAKEEAKIFDKVVESVVGEVQGQRYKALPPKGMPVKEVMEVMQKAELQDGPRWRSGKVSGQVYHGGDDVTNLLVEAFRIYAVSNPIHPETFPSLRKMEAEVVQMVVDLFNGGEEGCGTTTSGGTESILMGIKTHRDWARATKGITKPELVKPATAHAAFDKACHYLGIKCVEVPVDQTTFRVDLKAVKKAMNRNTIALVGSAITYPQGVMDDIEQLSDMAVKHGCGLHVDCCLGSFIMPMLDAAGYPTRRFDFRLPGVTSISCDTHKFGYAPKGSSIVMYRSKELRHYQYFIAGDWVGGIYATPAVAGSRPGAIIAGTWAVMMHFGKDGYLDACKQIMRVAKDIEKGVRESGSYGLKMMGTPDASVVCIGSSDPNLNILNVGDAMSSRGWRLTLLQFPACIHICVTLLQAREKDTAARFVADLRASAQEVRTAPKGKFKDSKGAIYGMAATIPDRSMINDIAYAYVDAQYLA